MATTTELTHCKVVSIGTFAGGSFGTGGNPAEVCELWKVDCPELREIEAMAHPAMPDYRGWVFRLKIDAVRAAHLQEAREIARAADRAERKKREEDAAARAYRVGRQLATCGVASPVVAIAGGLLPDGRLTAASVERVRAMMLSPTQEVYDARTADGSTYRVRVGSYSGLPAVAKLEYA